MNSSFISPVIKSGKVNVEGTVQIPIGTAMPAAADAQSANAASASARVIETTAQYATIEVVCPCGTVSRVRCNYN